MIERRSLLAGMAGTFGAVALGGQVRGQAIEPPIELKPELASAFAELGTEGVFVALDRKRNVMTMTDETRARRGLLPASTYKIPHAAIALETGVVADVDTEVIRWDGVVREFPDWNRDHTLRSAMRYSVVPVFQQIANRIGEERMHKFIDAFGYGNRDISGAPLDRFWLQGNLRVSPLQQIDFLTRFYDGKFGLADRSTRLVLEIIPTEPSGGATIHAKTGAIGIDGSDGMVATHGWLVGYVEQGGAPTFFAMNLDIHAPRHLAQRFPIAKALLQKIGAV